MISFKVVSVSPLLIDDYKYDLLLDFRLYSCAFSHGARFSKELAIIIIMTHSSKAIFPKRKKMDSKRFTISAPVHY